MAVCSAVTESTGDAIDTEADMTNTNNDMVTLPPPRPTASARALRVALPLLTLSWTVLAVILVASVVRVQRWETAPGSALAVAPRISFTAGTGELPERHPAPGGIMFVTALTGQLSALDAVLGWIDPHVQVQTFEERFGTLTPSQVRRLGYQSMVGSKEIAEYVAMRRLGYEAELVEGDVVVEQVVCEGTLPTVAACTVLDIGETIIALDGVPVPTLTVLSAQMANRKVGDSVELSVIPYSKDAVDKDPAAAEKRTLTLMEDPDTPGRPIIGFIPADTRTVSLPFRAEISTAGIGGPSAGLAFTLALLDELTPGNLMGRGRVAATGTMSADETVGAIGALEQKAVAVRESGATLFLVPATQTEAELAAARRAAGSGVRIVPVATLADALAALRANGGAALDEPGI